MEFLLIGQLLAVVLLIVLNGCLSGAEIAVIAANRTQLKQWADAGNSSARLALQLAQKPSRFLPAVQVTASLLNTLAAVLGGVAVLQLLAAPVKAARRWCRK